MRFSPVLWILVGVLVLSVACDDDCAHASCNLRLDLVTVIVVDETGEPVPSLDPVVTIVLTGERLEFDDRLAGEGENGVYLVITDFHKSLIDPDGELVRFMATADGRSAAGDFVISVPSCCHIAKESGPDTLVMH